MITFGSLTVQNILSRSFNVLNSGRFLFFFLISLTDLNESINCCIQSDAAIVLTLINTSSAPNINQDIIRSFSSLDCSITLIRIILSTKSPSKISQLLTNDIIIGGATWLAQIRRNVL